MTTFNDGDANRINAHPISFPGFDVSWVGVSPSPPGYWFGSDNGKIQFKKDLDSHEVYGPFAVAPSGEAVNGITVSGGTVAVSTRGDVAFLHPIAEFFSKGSLRRAVFPRGAHGVVATTCGMMIAPLGKRGLLMATPGGAQTPRFGILKPPGDDLNFYRVVSVASPSRGEVIACAARRGGFTAFSTSGDPVRYSAKTLRTGDMDFVDVAPLGVGDYPFGMAALGADCSIHLMRDLLDDRSSETIHFDLDRERAYRIACSGGHVFLLTNRRLYTFVSLAARFLQRGTIEWPTLAHSFQVEAVDMTMAFEHRLLVVMPRCVYSLEIDSLANGKVPLQGPQTGKIAPVSVTTESMATSENSQWEPLDSCELALSSLASG